MLFALGVCQARELTQEDRSDFERCQQLQEEGDWLAAREVARELVNRFAGEPPTKPALVFSNELANLNQRLGSYGAALERYRYCLQVAIQLEGEKSKTVAQIKNNLAALLQVLGQFEEAGELSRAALAAREALEGKGAAGTVPSMNNLAGLLWCIGDLAAAEGLYREGLRIRETVLGAEEIDTARSLANLAGLLFYRGEIAEAGTLADRAVRIFREKAGPTHPDTLEALLFFGDLERAAGRAEVAERAYREVYEGRIAAFGTEEHAEVAEALRRIGDALRELGQHGGARQAYRESDRLYRKVLPERHPDRLEGLYGLGLAALADGDLNSAEEAARQCAEIEFDQFEAMLKFTDERQRLAYQDIFRSQHLFAGLGDGEALASFLVRQKGIVSDSLINEARLSRDSPDPAVKDLQERLAAVRAEYRIAFLGSAAAARPLAELESEIAGIQTAILRAVSRSAGMITFAVPSLAEVQAGLEDREVLLDYFRFDRDLGNGQFEPRYGLVVISSGSAQFVDCCKASEVEGVIAATIPFFGAGSRPDDADATAFATMQQLYGMLLAPADSSLVEVDEVIISPDGALSFVPFACLIGPGGKFWIEDVDLRFYSSAREVVKPPTLANPDGEVILVGNPEFNLRRRDLPEVADRRGFLSTLRSQDLARLAGAITPLAGAEEEVRMLGPLVKEKLGRPVVSLIGEEATESEIRRYLDRPYAVHFATHGIYLPKALSSVAEFPTDSPYVPAEVAGFQNPMFGSWLTLAGSSHTVEAWSRGAVPDPDADGVLMANEAAEFDLVGTQLVTLSACDTASGEATTGDGVLGLRRGFRLAGAENILSTLWPINDAATALIMQEFYGGLTASAPASSLSATQRKWLVNIRDNPQDAPTGPIPVGGTYFAIYLAGPFLLGR